MTVNKTFAANCRKPHTLCLGSDRGRQTGVKEEQSNEQIRSSAESCARRGPRRAVRSPFGRGSRWNGARVATGSLERFRVVTRLARARCDSAGEEGKRAAEAVEPDARSRRFPYVWSACDVVTTADALQGTWQTIDELSAATQAGKTYFGPQTPVDDTILGHHACVVSRVGRMYPWPRTIG